MSTPENAHGHKHVADTRSNGTPAPDGATLGQLVAEASRDLSALIQAEVQLAKSELSFSAKAGGIGTAMFFVAGFMAAIVLILASIGFALSVYLLIAAIVVLVGVRLIKKVKAPTATIETAKEIPAAFRD